MNLIKIFLIFVGFYFLLQLLSKWCFKIPLFEGKLIGVKGQYLLFEDQTVFNVRTNEGQRVKLTIS